MLSEDGLLVKLLPFKNSVSRHMTSIRIDLIQKAGKEAGSTVGNGEQLHICILVGNVEEAYLAGIDRYFVSLLEVPLT